MNFKKSFFVTSIIFVLIFVLAGTTMAASDQIVLRLADTEVPGMPEYLGTMYFKTMVEERTIGKVKIEYYHSSQLGTDKQITPAVLAGTIDIAKCSGGNLAEYTDALYFAELPGLFKNVEHIRNVWRSEIREEKINEIREEIGATPIMFLNDGGAARALGYNGKSIYTPGDTKGFKFRTTGSPIEVALMEAWGASCTPIAWGELYTSLQQGVVDGLYGHPIGTYSLGMVEVIDHLTIINSSYITSVRLMSKKAVEKLGGVGSDLYNIIMETGKEAELVVDKFSEVQNKTILEKFEKDGVKVIIPDEEQMKEWREVAQTVWDEYVGEGKAISEEFVEKVLALELKK